MSQYEGRLLIVDDDVNTCKFWQAALGEEGFRVDFCHTLSDMKDVTKRYFVDAILLDLDLGEESGLDGLPFLVSESPFSRIFILTANASLDSAVDAFRSGVFDYITKDTNPEDIAQKVRDSLSKSSVESHVAKEEVTKIGLIGQGQRFSELCTTIDQVKDVDSTVLILGESGTGKEIVARALHRLSSRKQMRFEAINCAAIPESLLESELFGHKKGAFTDASSDRKGIFELCNKGTLLLDEIGDMPLSLQTKLLRVLQEKEVVPVGSSKPIKIDTRVIAATHRDLLEEIQSGRFREDLYYRLSVVPVNIPPLRHRKDDIGVLLEHFLKELNKRFNKEVLPPSTDVLRRIMSYDWPGNVRELKNAVERAVVLSPDGKIHVEHLFRHLHKVDFDEEAEGNSSGGEGVTLGGEIFDMALTDAKQAFEKQYLERLLSKTGGNIAELARRCGRYRADIYRLFEKYDIDHQSYRQDGGKAET
ncbi:sigma-54-dependent transcriptional regulator [Pseudobacteriovorax antillogorgiicola]|uniref:Two-component system, NtrC family, response regulator PilR/two-component system, NtrC family, response regulator HydG/two-component system, NtrC family, response regulator GlrR n=1 Tax=Pseudobacteriovorax antillogorgiicola TaxID=1513793 RepID=A0A1Y6BS89_9BACT|nr:sigma-54 dependent transcriptional regulator [Pseudobacteriovorax antillogorgiicola]TCS53750.1 two-component system response regulator PilR (NtrC family)/two-component system response regulator HydG/two-component system response regulator GlrR [Pseudobacteriovorax antillogorgiicola]SMF22600.1 two-component system, NtrC family, response regulator PilR/two-component system, NtrC family, response regulator HydG/two-component system, NtrC family, response regulator GlrR [Pseudobacteriovorax antill